MKVFYTIHLKSAMPASHKADGESEIRAPNADEEGDMVEIGRTVMAAIDGISKFRPIDDVALVLTFKTE